MIDVSDSGEDEVDDYISSIFEDNDLAAVHKTATKYLNYTNSYVPQWSTAEAFRETYQNWYASLSTSYNTELLTDAAKERWHSAIS